MNKGFVMIPKGIWTTTIHFKPHCPECGSEMSQKMSGWICHSCIDRRRAVWEKEEADDT